MVELSIMSSAWQNYIKHLNKVFNERKQIARVDTMTLEMRKEYNGIVIVNAGDWRVYFESEQELSFFVLKWA